MKGKYSTVEECAEKCVNETPKFLYRPPDCYDGGCTATECCCFDGECKYDEKGDYRLYSFKVKMKVIGI